MRTFLKYLVLSGILLSLASCSDTRLQYLGYTYWGGYDPKIDYGEWGRHPNNFLLKYSEGDNTDYGRDGQYERSSIVGYSHFYHSTGGNTHAHYLVRDYNYAVFCPEGYVSECDMDKFKDLMQRVSRRCLLKMLASMNRSSFVYDRFEKKYGLYLSDGVWKKIKSIVTNNVYKELGGWQILKPTVGIDKQAVFYKVEYKGNGWYAVFNPQKTDTVSVKMMYTGKFLNPVIVGVKNRKMNVDIFDTVYKANVDGKMWGFSTHDEDYMFLEFLCPMLYRNTQDKKLIGEDDFDKFKNKANSLKLSFVQKFYKSVVQSGNDIRKVQKKFHYSLVQHFMEMIDNQKKEANYDTGKFLPCSYSDFVGSNYTITYLGKDWYQVTSPKADGQQVRLKVVLYGKKLTPSIVGIQNPKKNIDYCPERFK